MHVHSYREKDIETDTCKHRVAATHGKRHRHLRSCVFCMAPSISYHICLHIKTVNPRPLLDSRWHVAAIKIRSPHNRMVPEPV